MANAPKTPSGAPWWFPGWPSLREVVTSVIALGILGFVATALWPHLSSGTDQEIARGKEIFAILGSIVGTIFGTNVKRGRLSTGQVIARDVTRSVTNKVVGGIVADLGKSVGGSLGSSVGRALVRGALGGLLRR